MKRKPLRSTNIIAYLMRRVKPYFAPILIQAKKNTSNDLTAQCMICKTINVYPKKTCSHFIGLDHRPEDTFVFLRGDNFDL